MLARTAVIWEFHSGWKIHFQGGPLIWLYWQFSVSCHIGLSSCCLSVMMAWKLAYPRVSGPRESRIKSSMSLWPRLSRSYAIPSVISCWLHSLPYLFIVVGDYVHGHKPGNRDTAAAKSLQSCLTLCDPTDGSPPGSPIPGFSRQGHGSGLPFPSPMHDSEKWKWSRSVVSNSSRPHGLQPTRLLRPWDFPGKSTGVGCHCLLQIGILGGHIGDWWPHSQIQISI